MHASLSRTDSQPRPSRHTLVDGLFRGLFSLIFIVAGTGHLLDPASITLRLENAPMGYLVTAWLPPTPLVLAAGVALLAGGLALFVGYKARFSALILIAILIPITVTVQIGAPTLGPLFKNIALLGGLLFFAANGAGGCSVDASQRHETQQHETQR